MPIVRYKTCPGCRLNYPRLDPFQPDGQRTFPTCYLCGAWLCYKLTPDQGNPWAETASSANWDFANELHGREWTPPAVDLVDRVYMEQIRKDLEAAEARQLGAAR